MVFSSLVFLFLFLPVLMLAYYLCPRRGWRNTVLLLASLLFYSWGEPKVLLLLLASTAAAYVGALLVERYRQTRPALCKAVYIVTLVLILSGLFVFKYLNFAAENLSVLLGRPLTLRTIALPIGISFYTFQTLSYVVDLYRGEIRVQKNYFWLLLYISLFPQLIAGPIVRYQTVEEEILCRRENAEEVWAGLRRFVVGLGKKVLLANNVALVCEAIYGSDPLAMGTAACWLAALAYALQIYFDFSGYSDMAIGLGQMFGFHFLENFRTPYASLSITEFWRRWHISLSSWFRDYVYIPLGGSRVSRPRWVFNILVVWGLTGFWHGAEWNFILWGLYYALLLLGEKLLWGRALEKAPRLFRWAYTFLLTLLGMTIFYHTDLRALGETLLRMFTFRPTLWAAASFDAQLLLGLPFVAIGLPLCFPAGKIRSLLENCLPLWVKTAGLLGLLGVCIAFILSSSFNPFLYFRF